MKLKDDPTSKIVFFDDYDKESEIVRYLFTSLKFEYGGMSKTPTSYHYEKAKDMITWAGLKPKDYINLLDSMFYKFVQMLPN